MGLKVVNINQAIRQVDQPFTLIELSAVGEIVLHGYTCLGAVNWHKHIDNDEAFLVLDGTMILESEWGNVALRAGELAVVPKGISHRSGSQLRTTVTLIHARGLPERKNGHRRVFGIPGAGKLNKIKLHEAAARTTPFLPAAVVNIDEYTLQIITGSGLSPAYTNYHSDVAWLALRGQVRIETQEDTLDLTDGDLVVIPRSMTCHWFSTDPVTLLWLGLKEKFTDEWGEGNPYA